MISSCRNAIKQCAGYVTAVQRRRQMGHKSDDTFMAYISRISGVHVQAIANGQEPDQEAIDFLRSMRTKLNTNAGSAVGASLSDVRFWRSNPLSYLDKRLSHTASQTYRPRPSHDPTEVNPFTGSSFTQPFSSTIARPGPSKHLAIYLRYDQGRAAIMRALYQNAPEQGLPLSSVVALYLPLARFDAYGWRYSDAASDSDDSCPDWSPSK